MCKESGPIHQGHQYKFVDDVVEERKSDMLKILEDLKEKEKRAGEGLCRVWQMKEDIMGSGVEKKLREENGEQEEKRREEGSKYGGVIAATLKKIDDHFDTLIDILMKRKSELRRKVIESGEAKVCVLTKQQSQLGTFLSQLYDCMCKGEDIVKMKTEGGAHVIIEAVNDFETKMKTAHDVIPHHSLPIVDGSIDVTLDESLRSVLSNEGKVEVIEKETILEKLERDKGGDFVMCSPLKFVTLSSHTLTGHPYQSWGFGGYVFTTSASNRICIRSLKVVSRKPGNWNVEIRRRSGTEERKDFLQWEVIGERKMFTFGERTPCEVWRGEVVLQKGESMHWMVDNFGNNSNGEIVGSGANTVEVRDGNVTISKIDFLHPSTKGTVCGTGYGFIGEVEYDLLRE